MPPKKVLYEVFCLVHGEQETSVFRIKIDKNEKVELLRKTIWEEEFDDSEHIKARNIKLYKVNIDLTTENPQRSSLGDRNIDIVSVLGGQLLLPTTKLERVFTTTPAEDRIHVIVEVPASPASASAIQASFNLPQDVTNEIHEMHRTIVQQAIETVSISKIDTVRFTDLTKYLDLQIEEVAFSGLHSSRSPPAFEWREPPESAQNNEYMEWLRRNIPLSGTHVWHDVKGNQQLPSLLRDPRLPFNVTGGTDVVVVNDYNIESDMIRESIYAVLKLKKSIGRKDIKQVVLQIIVADLITPKSRNVFGILSDLRNDWRIYWFDDDRTIKCWKAPSPGVAVQVIQDLLAGSVVNRDDTSTVIPAAKRVKLATLLSGRNTIVDDVAQMEDVYDVMSKEEIIHHKIGIASEIVRNIPSFLSMYS